MYLSSVVSPVRRYRKQRARYRTDGTMFNVHYERAAMCRAVRGRTGQSVLNDGLMAYVAHGIR